MKTTLGCLKGLSRISRDEIIETEIDSNLDFSHTVITTRMIIFFANFILCFIIYHDLYIGSIWWGIEFLEIHPRNPILMPPIVWAP